MQFDLINIITVGFLAFVAILMVRHYRGGAGGEEDDIAASQRRDVHRAIKSMQKDRES